MKANTANLLAKCLEEIESGGTTLEDCLSRHPAQAAELEPLLKAAALLQRLDRPEPSPAFRENARIRILKRVKAAANPGTQPASDLASPRIHQLTVFLRRVLVGLAVLVAMLLAGGVASAAAQSALPGDLLYPGKVLIENMQLAYAAPAEQAVLESQLAGNRLTEIQLLVIRSRYADIPLAVERYEQHVDQAMVALANVARSDSSATYDVLVHIEGDMAQYEATLRSLLAFVPAETRPALARAIEISQLWGLSGSDA